ncbi:MAG: tRNA 4-thiouridine(8) synthase ThiI [Ruminococcaceae bacterium]|nr:tRNA 4-thiouridine(8) synthase ThiI [Oscillospiraceae bacterium]
MMEVLIVKYGEIILKGLNRHLFEDRLLKNIRNKLKGLGEFKITKYQAAVYVEGMDDDFDYDEATVRLTKVFGILYVCRATKCEKDIEAIKNEALKCYNEAYTTGKTFKVEVKRQDKKFPLKSPEVQKILGDYIFSNHFKDAKVDVKNPDITVMAEIRDEGAYVYGKKVAGPGGLPLGINGKCSLMLSGGIDSPVAGYMIAKRGVDLMAVHFHSYPYTSERAKEKVITLAKILSDYAGRIELFVVPFTDIQLLINEKAQNDMLVLLMRRVMMRITEKLTELHGAKAIVTGESLGQVASQTIESMTVTNDVVSMPVFRPLIGMDKEEITKISRKIGTFETSIQPYEDCCTVFVPKHPKTKPQLSEIREEELKLEGIDSLVDEAIRNTEKIIINYSNGGN